MRKKIILSLLLLVLPVMVLMGCSGSGKSSAENVGSEPGEVSQEEENEETEGETPKEPESNEESFTFSHQGPGSNMGNLLHDGIALFYEGYTYHSDQMMSGNLMRTPEGATEGELLVRGSLHDINAGDGRIFSVGYIEPENPSDLSIYGIFMVNADGSGLKTIKEGNFEELLLYDEWLYFVDIMDGALYRMKTDRSEETLIMENVYEGYGILHGSIYVHASQGDDPVTYVWKLPMEGGEPVKIDEIGTFGGSVDMAADSIYYIRREDGDQGMTRYNALTGETSSVLDTWIDDVVGEGEWIYYFWSGRRQDNTDSGIYRSLPDGQEQTMLYQGDNIFSLNIAGGKLYWSTNDEQRRLSMMDIQGGEVSFVPLAK